MKKYKVDGMSCSSCQLHVEKAAKKVKGVTKVNVSLLTNEMKIEGNFNEKNLIKSIKKAGYYAYPLDENLSREYNLSSEDNLSSKDNMSQINVRSYNNSAKLFDNDEINILYKRFIFSFVLLMILMYFSMGNMLKYPIPNKINKPEILTLIEATLSFLILFINKIFFINGFKGLFHLNPNMDSLIAIGSLSSFLYSFFEAALLFFAIFKNDSDSVHKIFMNHIFFEESAMIPTIVTLGKMLESYSKDKTKNAIKSLIDLSPTTACVLKNGEEKTIKIEDINLDDILIIRPGEKIPVDGIIVEGEASIDESALTGESVPKDKRKGDFVQSGTINYSGFIKVKSKRIGNDTTLSKIINLVIDSSESKAPIARIADKISYIFVPSIIFLAILTFVVYIFLKMPFSFALKRAISVLLISCPCALGLATPLSIMVGNGKAAKEGILFKNASSLENTGKANIIVFDKTGTITYGKPIVTDIICENGTKKDTLLSYALALESKSEHPIGKAIYNYCKEHNVKSLNLKDFKALPGNGVTGEVLIDSIISTNEALESDFVKKIYAGNKLLILEKLNITIPDSILVQIEEFSKIGKIPILFSTENQFLGVIYVSDKVKDESLNTIIMLKKMGMFVNMLTGDNKNTAAFIGKKVGIDSIISDVMPDEKQNVIKDLKKKGKVIMVGDGINDAPSLIASDIGIAIGNGSDIAIDSADIVLEKSDLRSVISAISISKATIQNIKENLFLSFFYNALCIPLAIGIYQRIFNFNFEITPMLSSILMSLSSISVTLNALRLNLKGKKYEKNYIYKRNEM